MATATYCANTVLNSTIITPIRWSLFISWNLFFGLFCHILSISNSYPQCTYWLVKVHLIGYCGLECTFLDSYPQVYPQIDLTDYIIR